MQRFYFYIRLFFSYLANSLKSRMAYREDFASGFVAGLANQLIGVLFVATIFVRVPDIRGWRREEIFFIYGFSQVSLGLFFTFFSNLLALSESYIVEGNFDRILLRPLNSYFQVLTERVHLEECSHVLVGIGMMWFAVDRLHLHLSIAQVLATAALVLAACLIYVAIFTILSSLTFWFNDRGGVVSVLLVMEGFAKYPVTFYNQGIRLVMTLLVPYAFTAFYPSMHLLGRREYAGYVWLTPAVAAIFFAVGLAVWHGGVRAYDSTGS